MNDKEKAALGSIAASAGLTAAKAIVGLLTGSLAILSEAGHSLLDLSATVLTYFAVRISGKPADAEHQYGHGKVESVTALAETALLFLLSAVVIFEAVQRLLGAQAHAVEAPSPPSPSSPALSWSIFSARARCNASPRRHRAKRSMPMRCISGRTCGPQLRCCSGWAAWRSVFPGPTPRPRSSSRFSFASPAGGSAGALSIR